MTTPTIRFVLAAAMMVVLTAAGRWVTGALAGDQAAVAFQAALTALNGVPAAECSDGGLTPPPERDTCLDISREQAFQASSGLALVRASHSAGVQPFVALVGMKPDGTWGLWLTAPALYIPVEFPSDAFVCAAGGLAVRSSPSMSAAAVATLPDESMATVDGFLLTSAGMWSPERGSTPGEGWYHVSNPIAGWAPATNVVVADASCQMSLLPSPYSRSPAFQAGIHVRCRSPMVRMRSSA